MIRVYLNKAMMWLLKCFLKLFLMKVLHFFFFFSFFLQDQRKKQSTEAILVVKTQHCIHELTTCIQMWVRHIGCTLEPCIWSHMRPNFSMVQLFKKKKKKLSSLGPVEVDVAVGNEEKMKRTIGNFHV